MPCQRALRIDLVLNPGPPGYESTALPLNHRASCSCIWVTLTLPAYPTPPHRSVMPLFEADLECWLVFLNLHHEMMDVDEFSSHTQSFERVLRQDLLEPVIVLDELRQGTL